MGRYVTSLATELHRCAQGSSTLALAAIAERPLFGAPKISEDIPAILEELLDRGRPGGGSSGGGKRVLARAAQLAKADVVHTLEPRALVQSKLSIPRVITCHHVDSSQDASSWHGTQATVLRADRKRVQSADRIIAISSATAHELITRFNVPREKISVVHHGVSLGKWCAPPAEQGAARRVALGIDGRPYLLCVGAVNERKNVDAVFQGLSRARAMIGSADLTVVWAGELSRSERQKLRAKAKRAGVADAISLQGYVSDEDLVALYAGATALVFASRREGFGYPVVEAMAAGCPVVTSNCSSLVEVAQGAALTMDPDDTDAIADAIVLLADDNAERGRLAEAGLARASGFSLRRMVEGTLEAYERARRDFVRAI